MKHHVIYLPGLGDSKTHGQDDAIKRWEKYGLETHFFPLGWADKESFEPKFKRLLSKIDELLKTGDKVSLVGVSAGASAALNAYALRSSLSSVVLICGKVNDPQSIGESVYLENPAFKQSVFAVKDSLAQLNPAQIKRIMSIHPLRDQSVPVPDTIIKGALEKTVPVIGHIFGIFFTIVFKGKLIAKFIKSS